MTDILIGVLNMSAAASIVAAAVITARLPLKKAPKIFSYALWAVVFLRLVCPVSFESPASLMPANAEIIPHSAVYEPVPRVASGVTAIDEPINRFIENSLPEANPAESINPIQLALTVAAYIWLLGMAAMLLYAAAGYIRLKRRVYDATVERGNVYRTDKAATAFVLGIVRPKIYVPTNISGGQLEHILKHERIHIKRRDYIIKPLAFIVLAVHWFNPLIWISYFLMSKDMEMSCDEAVLHNSANDLRQAYSMSLVNLYARKPALLSPLAFGEGSYNNMKARIKNVLNFKKAPRWAVIICSSALVIFTVGFTTNPPRNLSADAVISTVANNIPASDKEALPGLGIFANGGAWSAASGIGGDTWQDQIDYEIKWLNDTYAKNNTDFVITESLAASEASEVSRINYLYDNSDIFRGMSVMSDGAFPIEGILTYPTGSLTADTIHRTAVMLDNNGELTLDIDYSLEAGKIAVWLVDPSGTAVYQGNMNTLYKGSVSAAGKKGLWSVIRVYDGGDESSVDGKISLILRQKAKQENNTTGTAFPDSSAGKSVGEADAGVSADTFPINAWIQNDFGDSGANLRIEFPEWYAEDIWDVEFLQGSSPSLPISYSNSRRILVGIGNDTTYRLRVKLANGDRIVFDLWDLYEKAKTESKFEYLPADKEQADKEPTDNDNQSDNFSVMGLGSFSLKSGDIIKSSLSWDNSGTVVVLYTAKSYTDSEILAALQGVPGMPETEFNAEPSGSFNFTSSSVSPIDNEQKVTKAGEYYFYIVHGGFNVFMPYVGGISRVDESGKAYEIWSEPLKGI